MESRQNSLTMKIVSENQRKSHILPEPHAYLDNRGITKEKPKIKQSYSSRLGTKHRTKTKLAGILSKLGEDELVERVSLCGSKFTAITCGTHIVQRKPHFKCDFRLCPFCAERRSKKLINKYLSPAVEFAKKHRVVPVHLVLTLKHRRDEDLKGTRQRLLNSFKKLIKRKFFEGHFAGGTYAVETTIGRDGLWHCHLHILGFRRRFFDIELLRQQWLSATGDSSVLRLDKIEDLHLGLREVFKYISKPLDIEKFDAGHIKQFLRIKGLRMFGKFGHFDKFCRDYEPSDNEDVQPVESTVFFEGDACPVCSRPLFELSLTVENLIVFARRLETVPRL